MVIALLWNVSDNREIIDSFNGGKKAEKGYFKEGVVRSGKAS